MPNWTSGYIVDVEYTAGFYRELTPMLHYYVALLNGANVKPLDEDFDYCELGCGRGFSSLLIAATNPKGRFWAVDFNPTHITGAQALADQAGIRNLTLIEEGFESLAHDTTVDMPAKFDIISLHGVISWISPENRKYAFDFVKKRLKPGGIVYISYNALPGWAPISPLQRLLREQADLYAESSDQRWEKALGFINRIKEMNLKYFTHNPSVNGRLERLATAQKNYLIHEYLHKHWYPFYHADVARELAEAKLTYVGSATVADNFPALTLNKELQAILNEISVPEWRETFKDYCVNQQFRRDIFVRGPVHLSHFEMNERLRHIAFCLTVPRADASLKMQSALGEVMADSQIYLPILDALATTPKTLDEIKALPDLKKHPTALLSQALALLVSNHQAAPLLPYQVDSSPAQKLNRVLSQRAYYEDTFQALAAPPIGTGIHSDILERLVYGGLTGTLVEQEPDAQKLASTIWENLKQRGHRLVKEGKPLEEEHDNMMELQERIRAILANKLPLWRQLAML